MITYVVELNKKCEAIVERVDGQPPDGLCGPWPTKRGKSGLQQIRLALRRSEYVEMLPGPFLPVVAVAEYGSGGGM